MIESPEINELKKIDFNRQVVMLIIEMPVLKEKLFGLCSKGSFTPTILLEETLKFLYLVAFFKKPLCPSLTVDLAWHEFILCTKLYAKYCQNSFGGYIHHTPGGDDQQNRANYLKTIRLYITCFGEPQKEIWGEMGHNEWLESQCGTCNSN